MDPFAGVLAQPESSFEAHAKTLLAAAEADVARIDAQIRDLMVLRQRRRASIAALKYAVSPIRKLPTEMLAEMFVFRHPPASTMEYGAGGQPHEQEAEYAAMLKIMLERSHPLPIPVRLEQYYTSGAGAVSREVVDVFASVASRWSYLWVSDVDIFRALKQLPAMGNLHHLFLVLRSDLTSLNLTEDDPQDCLDILLQYTSIVEVEIRAARWRELPPISAAIPIPTLLPSLQKLSLQLPGGWPSNVLLIEPFFWRLSLPALDILSIYVDLDYPWTASLSTAFSRFLSLAPALTTFELSMCLIDSHYFLEALAHMPNLRKLDLDFCWDCIDDPVLIRLTYKPGSVTLIPRLERLRLGDVHDNFTDELFMDMVESRWALNGLPQTTPATVARLQYVSLAPGDDHRKIYENADVRLRMEAMKSQGLDIDIS
ncbi:hypothetical protein C8F01DRAFT_1230696 [Mycena amicta]|nr:hypothetical protein C8F01DRAFT_1230696 [Mycena amicta]